MAFNESQSLDGRLMIEVKHCNIMLKENDEVFRQQPQLKIAWVDIIDKEKTLALTSKT